MSEPKLYMQKIASRGYVFDDFTLDLDRGCLWRAGQEVKLRYKSFEALKYLVERSGRVVSKEDTRASMTGPSNNSSRPSSSTRTLSRRTFTSASSMSRKD
ncbi:MAG TPA: hypothetical protein VJ810_20985 [Blastocatellia bacterium]|nr:hypothetical protein [Blastocatellia bacterium]